MEKIKQQKKADAQPEVEAQAEKHAIDSANQNSVKSLPRETDFIFLRLK